MTTSDQPRGPDGRRGGPIAVGEPAAEDRTQVAELQRQAAERRAQELEAQQAAAEPAGVPPSDDQRQATVALRDRSAELRGPAARALRRQPVAVGTIYDDEREAVEDLHADARDARLQALAERGIVDPAIERQTAGFDPELPGLPGHELYGVFACPHCAAQVERSFPGYVDWDLASRDLVCPQCGGIVKRGGAAAEAQSAQTPQTPQTGEALPTGEPGTYSPPPLSADERAELEQLRRERAEREAASTSSSSTPPPAEPAAEQPTEQPPSG